MSSVVSKAAASRRGRWFFTVEVLLSLLIVFGLVWDIVFLFTKGFLPRPFFHDTNDTFMDWYNAAFWAYKRGAYDIYISVYPPISFIFLRLFSAPGCYYSTELVARGCDPFGIIVLAMIMLVNTGIVYVVYRKNERRTAIVRTFALCLGMPMLFAWERGNLILPCFTLLVLGQSSLLRRTWLKWVCLACAINFKPYLIFTVVPDLVRRRWRWVEGAGVAFVVVFTITYVLYGEGNPLVIINNIRSFAERPTVFSADSFAYATTYKALLDILREFPLMHFVGSRPIEALEWGAPVGRTIGDLGIVACFLGVFFRPHAVRGDRLTALSLAFVLTSTEPGIYAEAFLFFFVFLGRSDAVGQKIALVFTYLLCVPWDYPLFGLAHQVQYSYLGGRMVGYDIALTLGQFIRPALLLMVEYGLVLAALSDLLRAKPLPEFGIKALGVTWRESGAPRSPRRN